MVRRLLHALAAGALVLTGGGAVVVAAAGAAQACDFAPRPFRQQLESAGQVFSGTVTARQGGGRVTYEVEVTAVYAGDLSVSPVEVVSRSDSCGITDIETGSEWLFLTNDRFRISQLDGSGPATEKKLARAEQVLGAPRVLAEPEPERDPLEFTAAEAGEPFPLSRLVAPGGAALLVGFLGWVAVRRVGRRR